MNSLTKSDFEALGRGLTGRGIMEDCALFRTAFCSKGVRVWNWRVKCCCRRVGS